MIKSRNSQYMHDEKGHNGNYNYNLDQFVGMQEKNLKNESRKSIDQEREGFFLFSSYSKLAISIIGLIPISRVLILF